MPLKNDSQSRRWSWIEAINWIAFDKPDCRETPLLGADAEARRGRCEAAVDELIEAVRSAAIEPIWGAYVSWRLDDPCENLFTAGAEHTRRYMIQRLEGVISIGDDCPLAFLQFESAKVKAHWPAPTPNPIVVVSALMPSPEAVAEPAKQAVFASLPTVPTPGDVGSKVHRQRDVPFEENPRTKINTVLDLAKAKYPLSPGKKFNFSKMARELAQDKHGLGYDVETIRQILNGTSPTMKGYGINSPYALVSLVS